MRQAKLLALMISLCLLAGCASGTDWEEELSKKRERFAQAGELSFTSQVSADLGETVFECTLECRRTREETSVRVTEPELAEGVTVRFENGGASMDFGGTELYLGPTQEGVPTPARSAPLIFDALTAGHAVRVWTESAQDGEMLCAQVYAGENCDVLLWFDTQELEPRYAQIVCAGRAVISCRISDFKCESE